MSTEVRSGINPERMREFLARYDAALERTDEERAATDDEVGDLLTRAHRDPWGPYAVTIPEYYVLRGRRYVCVPEEQLPVSWFFEWDEEDERVVADRKFEDRLEAGEVYG